MSGELRRVEEKQGRKNDKNWVGDIGGVPSARGSDMVFGYPAGRLFLYLTPFIVAN